MSAAELFLKINQLEIAFPYLQKARNLIESMTRSELYDSNEWKSMMITIMKHYSSHYLTKND